MDLNNIKTAVPQIKNKKHLFQKGVYFSKLFLTLLLSCLLISIIIISFFYLYSYRASIHEKELTNHSTLLNYVNSVDIRLRAATAQIEKFKDNQKFVTFAMNGGYQSTNMMEVYNELENSKYLLDAMGVGVGVINPKVNTSLLTGYFNKLDLNELKLDYNKLSLNSYTYIDTNGMLPIYEDSEKEGMIFVLNQIYSGEYPLIFVIVLYNNSNTALTNNDNYIIMNKDKIGLMATKAEKPNFNLNFDNNYKTNAYSIYSQKSTVIPTIRYIYYTKNTSVIWVFLLQLIIILLFLIFLSIGISYYMSKKLYSPISQAISSLQHINTSDSTDEIKYVNETAKIVYDSINELTLKAQAQQNLIKSKFIYDLSIGIVTKSDAKEYVTDHTLSLLTKKHTVILFEIVNFYELSKYYDPVTYKSVKSDLTNIFLEALTTNNECYFIELENSKFAFITENIDSALLKKLNEVCSSIELADDISIIASVGSTANDYTQTETSYHDALYVSENYSFSGESHVYTLNDIAYKQSSSLYYPIEIERQIIENMTNSKQSNAISLVEKIVDYNIKEGFTKQKQTELKFLIISTINRILGQINQSIDSVFGDGTILYLELTSDNDNEIKKKIIRVFERLGESLPNEEDSENTGLKKIIEFIDDNIDKDISLMDLSEHLNFSTWYVSKMFKTIVKQNFKAYVNQRRVEVAKKILDEEPNSMIADVAIRVGCNNTVTFNRTFKKYTGLSPSEYRQNK